jgi:hypothetical protein
MISEVFYQSFMLEQQRVCTALDVEWREVDFNTIVGLSANLKSENPLHGLRHPAVENTSGWFLWAGELSEADDFFSPYHLYHLVELKPALIRYLALPPGFRFICDDNGYEDIWFDESLLTL